MSLENIHLSELKQSELKQTSGGNFFAYALGYAVGTAVAVLNGAYEQGFDEAQKNCDCK